MSILIIGDSFSCLDARYTVWPTLLGQRLSKGIWNRAQPGCGYSAMGNQGDNPNRFSRQILRHPEFPTSEIELAIMFGSCNDRFFTDDFYRSMVFATHRELAREYPTAKQLIITPQWSGTSAKPDQIDWMRTVINDTMWSYDWQYPYLEPTPPNAADWWFPPNRPELWGPDQFHPNQLGHNQMADKIEPHVRKLLGL